MALRTCAWLCLLAAACGEALAPQGTAAAVDALLERVIPGSSAHFVLRLYAAAPGGRVARGGPAPAAQAALWDCNGKVCINGTTASELTAGVGWYLRERCNMTFGWPRGGGARMFLPPAWPAVGGGASAPVVRPRAVPWSYVMNVCTHSYSLVWYGWKEWEAFIDWMALSGINLALALTGQEEVQYKVFQKFGLGDKAIRTWFNGPAFLTWSRGQNEYGSNIAGTLPRSFMQAQWALNRQILTRYRSLGIVGQLPAFQGNVPAALAKVQKDADITIAGATGWMSSTDPLFGRIADVWMETLMEDFGTDHWYQLDGYFNGGTAPWLDDDDGADPYPAWYARGAAAYMGLNRTDPDAVWSFQGWAIIGWHTAAQARSFEAFVDAAPPGKLAVIDMEPNGKGQWRQFNASSFFGAPFVWTALHDFGGTDAVKGNLAAANALPFAGLENTTVFGTGITPEGIDQNPIFYDFVIEQNFRAAPTADLTAHVVGRVHRRYGLAAHDAGVAHAWELLVAHDYMQDVNVQDPSGVPHLPATASKFEADRRTPSPPLCATYAAWGALLDAAGRVPHGEPFRYDVVNVGREVLAQVAAPLSMNFSDAMAKPAGGRLDAAVLNATGTAYIGLLRDVDELVGTDPAFLLGSWIEMARARGGAAGDCGAWASCADYMEWNARCQISTWNPTPAGARKIPAGPIDYASKHWHGLVRDYYGGRAEGLLAAALRDAAAHAASADVAAQNAAMAAHAHAWQQPGAFGPYPSVPQGDFAAVAARMHAKYAPYFAACASV